LVISFYLTFIFYSIYDILDPDRHVQTVFLGDSEVSYSLSLSHPSPISGALGDCVMSFDFGPSEVVEKKSGSYRASKMDTRTVWPIYCVRGNGDVIIAYTDLSHRSVINTVLFLFLLNIVKIQ
jgi:hypothetical protein